LLVYDLLDHQDFGDCALATFSSANNEIVLVLSFEVEREQSAPIPGKRSGLQLNQAAPRGTSDSFGAADDIHLGEDRFYVRLNGAFADK
jgi:hypothetical protein